MYVNEDKDLNCRMCGTILVLTVRRPYDSRTGKIRDNKKEQLRIKLAMSLAETRGFNDWVEVDTKNLKGTFMRIPERQELPSEINESLIVELYSK